MTDNISELTRFSGILRGQESFAQAISFGINTQKFKDAGRVPLAVNTILLGKFDISSMSWALKFGSRAVLYRLTNTCFYRSICIPHVACCP